MRLLRWLFKTLITTFCIGFFFSSTHVGVVALAQDASVVSYDTWQQVYVSTKALRYYLESKNVLPAGGEGLQFVHWITYAPSNSNIVYMGVDTDTIWKSTDGGTTWKRQSKGIKSNGILSITVDPLNANRVFVTGLTGGNNNPLNSEGIYRTLDGGENWQFVKGVRYEYPGQVRFGGNMIAVVGSTIYAGTYQDGLLKSIDDGNTWVPMLAYAMTGQIYDVKKHPTDNSIIYVSSANGLKKVASSGGVTSVKASGLVGPASPLLINPKNPLIMFAGDDTDRIMKSIDGGETFTVSFDWSIANNLSKEKHTTWMDLSPSDPNYVFVSFGPKGWGSEAQKDFYYTQNALVPNVTWHTAQSMDEQNQYGWVAASLQNDWNGNAWGSYFGGPIAMHPTNKNIALIFGGPGVIKKTSDGGLNWRYSNAGFTALGSIPYSIFSWDKNRIRGFAVANTDRGLFFSENNGHTFEHLLAPGYSGHTRGYGVAVGHGSTEDVIVAAVGNHSDATNANKGQRIVVSKNKGVTWTQISSPDTADNYLSALITFSPTNSNVIYAGKFRSTDGGNTWKELSRYVNAVYWRNGDIVYSTGANSNTGNAVIYKSTNRGDSWTLPYPEIPTLSGGVRQIAVSVANADKIFFAKRDVGVFLINNVATPVLRNQNHGLLRDHWGAFNFWSIATDPNNANVVYVGNYTSPKGHDNRSIFRSTDSGNSWQTVNYNLNDASICGLRVNPHDSYVYVSTWGGIWKLPPPSSGDDGNQPLAPAGLRVVQ